MGEVERAAVKKRMLMVEMWPWTKSDGVDFGTCIGVDFGTNVGIDFDTSHVGVEVDTSGGVEVDTSDGAEIDTCNGSSWDTFGETQKIKKERDFEMDLKNDLDAMVSFLSLPPLSLPCIRAPRPTDNHLSDGCLTPIPGWLL